MMSADVNPVVHLELLTDKVPRACASLTRLFDWRAETVHVGSMSYLTLDLGRGMQAGVVDTGNDRPVWMPYVEVTDVARVTRRARLLGAAVVLEPREGPAGWRSIIAPPGSADIALWQPKA